MSKDILGYEGLYKITNDGLVISLARKRIIEPTKKSDGYLQVKLYRNGISKMHYVQRLVAIAFISNPNNKPFVNHKDGVKNNNRFYNLEWVTRSENTYHSFENGLQISKKYGDHPLAKIVLNTVTGIYYSCIKEACATTNLKYGTFLSQVSGVNKNNSNFILV